MIDGNSTPGTIPYLPLSGFTPAVGSTSHQMPLTRSTKVHGARPMPGVSDFRLDISTKATTAK